MNSAGLAIKRYSFDTVGFYWDSIEHVAMSDLIASERKTIDPETLSKQLGLSRNSTYAALQEGKIPGAVQIGRRWLIPVNAADRLLSGAIRDGAS